MMAELRIDSRPNGGFALITVILVLAALLLLCTPFMLTARNADQASQQLFHRAEANIALDNASTHARAWLEQSHPAFDSTLYADGVDELTVNTEFHEDFLNARDAHGIMWDVTTADVAGQIDLGSAPPQVFGALMGSVTRLVGPVTEEDGDFPLASVGGLDPSGHIWIGGELVKYDKIEGNKLVNVQRGVGARFDAEDKPLPGPLPAVAHGVGTAVIDQRAFAPVEWRLYDGDVREFDSFERLEEVNQWASPENQLVAKHFDSLMKHGTVFGGVGTGPRWQRAARMTSAAERDVTGGLRVDSLSWFNAGSTIKISNGTYTELAIVRRVRNGGWVELDRALSGNYDAYEAEVSVLARRPVNINAAHPEVIQLLLENLKLRGKNHRITGGEAEALTNVIVESRPFEGFEDFMRRVVLPAAEIEPVPADAWVLPDVFAESGTGMAGLIDSNDAVALYRNALNANDFQLEYSTMPFSFVSNNVYDVTARAVINASSGVERSNAIREETHVVVPQEELLHVWATQEDFDMLLRLKRQAPYWMTGPEATSRHGSGNTHPPSRIWAQMGTYNGSVFVPGSANFGGLQYTGDAPNAQHIFPDRGPDGFMQLFHHPVDDAADPDKQGRVIHFTHETRHLEARFLPDETLSYSPQAEHVQWDAPNGIGLLRGFDFSFWMKPTTLEDSVILDVGGSSQGSDRVSVLFEGGDLVLRAIGAGGDHNDPDGNPVLAQFVEQSELRYALGTSGESPGLPIDTWHHIYVDVRGTRPSQMTMLVNGLAFGVRTPGMTKLSSGVGEFDTLLPVESVEGFPPIGVVRIGNELIEYRVSGDALEAIYVEQGADAGFGGRDARVMWTNGDAPGVSDPPATPQNYSPVKLSHPQGSTVELYGFAQILASDIPGGQGTLPDTLGSFRVGVVNGVVGGPTNGEQINVTALFGAVPVGTGIRAVGTQVTSLLLGSAEEPDNDNADYTPVMEAFSKQGGYALLMQGQLGNTTVNGGHPVGGWSVIRYTGWNDNILEIGAWGDAVPELQNLQNLANNQGNTGGGPRAFVVNWEAQFVGDPVPIQDHHQWRLFIIPISLPVSGASSASFLPADKDNPMFAEITEAGANENTEWVCYNEIVNGTTLQLVRDDPFALEAARFAAIGPLSPPDIADPNPNQGGGGPGTGQPNQMVAAPPPVTGPMAQPTVPSSTPALGSAWQPILGEPEDLEPKPDGFPITRAVREAFQFRGTMGTYPHDHVGGTPVRPVFQLQDNQLNGGAPGRNDPVFLFEASPTHLGWPVTIARAYLPRGDHVVHAWALDPSGENIARVSTTNYVNTINGIQLGVWYATLRGPAPAPVSAAIVQGGSGYNIQDSRMMARFTRFPSGERPREATTVNVGGEIGGGRIPNVYVDELVFGATKFGGTPGQVDPETVQAAQLWMQEPLPDYQGQDIIHVPDVTVRIAKGNLGSTYKFLGDLDTDGGLLRIGTEILAYDTVDVNAGQLTIPQNGRALLGTERGEHEPGSAVTFLDGWQVAILSAGIGPDDASIPVQSTNSFPGEGTLLIDGELIHYTRLRNGAFEMPLSSSEPGRMDQRGAGIFRGRYGTEPAAHTAGTPAIFFPIRYWDRWAHQADGPELAYFGLELAQPAAFWRSFTWQEEESAHPGLRLGVLVRSDRSVPWDADPETTDGLDLYYRGGDETRQQPIGTQSDGVEWRVFAEYTPEAFGIWGQANWGWGHGWRATPRLNNFLVEYLGPSMTLRSVNR